jgi:hypothetical protein
MLKATPEDKFQKDEDFQNMRNKIYKIIPFNYTSITYLLDIYLYILLKIISIQIQNQIMNEVKPITDNDKW